MTAQPPSIKRPGLLGGLALVSMAAAAAACVSLAQQAEAARAETPAKTGAARAALQLR